VAQRRSNEGPFWLLQVMKLMARCETTSCSSGQPFVAAFVEGGGCRHGDGEKGERLGLGFLFGKQMMTWQALIGQFNQWRIATWHDLVEWSLCGSRGVN